MEIIKKTINLKHISPKLKSKKIIEAFESEIGHSDLNVLSKINLDLDLETKQLAIQCAKVLVKEMIQVAINDFYNVHYWLDVESEILKQDKKIEKKLD